MLPPNKSEATSPNQALEWTGERYVPSVSGNIRYEHYHRYAVCQETVRDKNVLDIACGEGYGSYYLAGSAKSVVGVDISDDAIKHAQDKYGHQKNLKFAQGGVEHIPLNDHSVEVVVSFETIEHVLCHQEMLSEIRRVLTDQGVLIISTPDKEAYAQVSEDYNEYHVKELYTEEFRSLLAAKFKYVELYGQRFATGSFLTPFNAREDLGKYDAWANDSDSTIKNSTTQLNSPVYIVAVCSDHLVSSLHSSIYLDGDDDLYEKQVATTKWAITLHDELQSTKDFFEEYKQHSLDQIEALMNQTEALMNQIEALVSERIALTSSLYWKITAPIRVGIRVGSKYKTKFASFGLSALWASLKFIDKVTPVPHEKRLLIKTKLFHWFPKLKLSTPGFKNSQLAAESGHYSHSNLGSDRYKRTIKPGNLSVQAREIQIARISTRFSNLVSNDPIASIIIPVFGEVNYSLMCLTSLSKMICKVPYEIIVVDDCSPDDTSEVLSRIADIKVVTNSENSGFIRSCNAGADIARGTYLVFLNNDTEVLDNWLDELIGTLTNIEDAGIVGSRLVYPDGRLQEAGGIIWNDGSAWNFGREGDPDHPQFSYLREVDYCSGASIAISKSLFEQVGGFDEHYLPAYAEDSDLAFKIRATGNKVYYQPLSTVIHYEGVTSGTDTNQGVKAYQIENGQKLFDRWKNEIKKLELPGENVDKAKDKGRIGRVLVLDHCTPTPDIDAGSITTLNIMRLLCSHGYQVTFIPEDNFLYMPDYTTALQRLGVEVLYAPYIKSIKQHLQEFGQRYDGIMLFRPLVAERHLDNIETLCPGAKILYHASDLHYLRLKREAELEKSSSKLQAAEKYREKEINFFQRAETSIVHSTVEANILKQEYGINNVHVFPWAIDIKGTYQGFHSRADICFIGSYQHPPNTDAAIYFIDEILPLIQSLQPEIKFYAIGSKPPEQLKNRESDSVVITGYVEDLDALLDRMLVAVAPLRYGAGIKGKIGTTLSQGLPCVATSVAAEGMELTDGRNIILADDPQLFADAVLRLYHSELLWNEISVNGIEFADRMYGMKPGFDIMGNILESSGMPCLTSCTTHATNAKPVLRRSPVSS